MVNYIVLIASPSIGVCVPILFITAARLYSTELSSKDSSVFDNIFSPVLESFQGKLSFTQSSFVPKVNFLLDERHANVIANEHLFIVFEKEHIIDGLHVCNLNSLVVQFLDLRLNRLEFSWTKVSDNESFECIEQGYLFGLSVADWLHI